MPNRIIKESICTSDEIDQLSAEQEVFFYRLMVVVDDFGLIDARLPILKSKCYPLKSIDINSMQVNLARLVEVGLVSLYIAGGKPYLSITNWAKHQQIRAKRAKCPMPEEGVAITCNQLISNAPVIQSNPIRIQSESNPNPIPDDSPTAHHLVPSLPAEGPDDCPHQQIVAIYHEVLPMCSPVKIWTPKRSNLLRGRWRENPKRQNLEFWRRFFGYVAESKFLTGKVSAKDREPFTADIEWLINPTNFTKVVEGKYHKEQA